MFAGTRSIAAVIGLGHDGARLGAAAMSREIRFIVGVPEKGRHVTVCAGDEQ
jgi:hypothetical protein